MSEIGFVESFALASGKERETALTKLAPGSEDYYFYNIVHLLHQGAGQNKQKITDLLAEFYRTRGEVPKYKKLKARFQLQLFDARKDDKQAQQELTDWLSKELNLHFSHQQQYSDSDTRPSTHPNKLDPSLVSFAHIVKSHSEYRSHLYTPGEGDEALARLKNPTTFDTDGLLQFLARLQRPDIPNLPQLIAKSLDTNTRNYVRFGQHAVHNLLTVSQLEELIKLKGDLLSNSTFVNLYVTKLAPSGDVDWKHSKDTTEKEQYLKRVQDFVGRLPESFNSHRFTLLYHSLKTDQAKGVYDKEKFVQYMQVPRANSFAQEEYLNSYRSSGRSNSIAQFGNSVGLFPGVSHSDDTALVQDFLLHLYATPEYTTLAPFDRYVRAEYLAPFFAEAKLTNGVGGAESEQKWFTHIESTDARKRLIDRVDVQFAPENPTYFDVDEDVVLQVFIKNVPQLLVKVFEINTTNYYKDNLKELPSDINLDGLVANEEQKYTYNEAPIRRVKRSFSFKNIGNKRGLYVIEFIGNGQSSRAVIRKGGLQYVERLGVAGHVFSVIDNNNNLIKDATIWSAGHLYKPNEAGEITIPFSSSHKAREAMIISDSGASASSRSDAQQQQQQQAFSALHFFAHRSEDYQLFAGFYVDRESLIKNKKAQVIVRPQLYVHDTLAPLAVLENVEFSLICLDADNVKSQKDWQHVKLENADNSELTFQFNVPENLRSLQVTLRGQIQIPSCNNQRASLEQTQSFTVNAIDNTDRIEDVHLLYNNTGYNLLVLGKTGEPKADRVIYVTLKHRLLNEVIYVNLQTDKDGRVHLGKLDEISWITAGNQGKRFDLVQDKRTYPSVINVKSGQLVNVPFIPVVSGDSGNNNNSVRAEWFSFFEKRNNSIVQDLFNRVSYNTSTGMLEIAGLAPGDYELHLKREAQTIAIHVANGKQVNSFVCNEKRMLQLPSKAPVHIASVSSTPVDNKDSIKIKLVNATQKTRVHIVSSHFVGAFDFFTFLTRNPSAVAKQQHLQVIDMERQQNQFLSGRELGEEYRYILERKYGKHHTVGNMLPRPQLLLNPWAVRGTETSVQDAAAGSAYASSTSSHSRAAGAAAPRGGASAAMVSTDSANVDFLPQQSVLFVNLRPDANGDVIVSRESLLGIGSHVRVIVVDGDNVVFRQIGLADVFPDYRDMRLAADTALDPQSHFTEQKEVSVVNAGDSFTVADFTTSSVEIYDTLEKVHGLLVTLSGNSVLTEKFSWIPQWSGFTRQEKEEKYSKFACHELSFFISKKDPLFFEEVVEPYILNKKEKTFLDYYLLGDEEVLFTHFLTPYEYHRLNVVEQLLLAHSLKQAIREHDQQKGDKKEKEKEKEKEKDKRHPFDFGVVDEDILQSIRDSFRILPPNLEQFNTIFNTALKGRSLETTSRIPRREEAVNFLEGARNMKERRRVDAAPMMATTTTAMAMPQALYAAPASRASFGGGGLEAKMMLMKKREVSDDQEDESEKIDEDWEGGEKEMAEEESYARDLGARESQRRLYQKVEKTQEYAENNYFQLPLQQHTADLITVNAFWSDYAAYLSASNNSNNNNNSIGAFVSKNFALCTRNFTEIMYCLSLLDLPFAEADSSASSSSTASSSSSTPTTATVAATVIDVKDTAMTVRTQQHPLVVFHKQIKKRDVQQGTVLVSQNYFDPENRYSYEENEQVEKYITDEFLINKVYGCHVVLTNVSMNSQRLDLLLQIPQGALPVSNGFFTKGRFLELSSYSTQVVDFHFYFPFEGRFGHFPVHVAKNEAIIACAPPVTLDVKEKPTQIDTSSWEFVSQRGSVDQVFDFLSTKNLHRVVGQLHMIAWRLKQKDVFVRVTDILRKRCVFDEVVWSYSVHHKDLRTLREYLPHNWQLLDWASPYLETSVLTVDPFDLKSYEHLEYAPLVNARAHTLGKEKKILNNRFHEQYLRFLRNLCYKPKMDAEDLMSASYYLLLQDRVEEAKELFTKVKSASVEEEEPKRKRSLLHKVKHSISKRIKKDKKDKKEDAAVTGALPLTQLQYDYMSCYFDFFSENSPSSTSVAGQVSAEYLKYPVPRWRNMFTEVHDQIMEIEQQQGGATATTATTTNSFQQEASREQQQARLSATEPTFEFTVESKQIKLDYQNVSAITVSFFVMDIELMFSTNPFVMHQTQLGQFAYIKPTLTQQVTLPPDQRAHTLPLPAELEHSNVIINVSAAGQSKSQPYYSQSLNVQVVENYGQLQVTLKDNHQPLARSYVKVYARKTDGKVAFYKDGYTDHRGKFDYASLSTNELDSTEKFSILVISEKHGALVKEANKPKV